MNCKQSVEQLPLYCGGDIEPDELEAVKAHLADCASCADALSAYRQSRAMLVAQRPELPADFWDGYTAEITGKIVEGSEAPGLLAELAPQKPSLPADFWNGYTEAILERVAVSRRPVVAQPVWNRMFKVAMAASVLVAAVLSLRAFQSNQPVAGVMVGQAGGDLPLLTLPEEAAPATQAPSQTLGHQLQNHPVPSRRGALNVAHVPQARSKATFVLEEARVPKDDDDDRSFSF